MRSALDAILDLADVIGSHNKHRFFAVHDRLDGW